MRKLNMGWMMALALGLAVPSFSNALAGSKSSKAAKGEEAPASTAGMSKDEQQRISEHNKLRAEIKKVKYPAAKADIVARVKGVKADDKKWFADTLPDKTYGSADDVFSALGWETAPRAGCDAQQVTAARAGVLAMSIVACTHPRPPVNPTELARVERWWIVIGSSPVLESLDWRHYARGAQLVVLSGDPRIPIKDFPAGTIRLAYVSVGEADTRRPNWPALRDQPFLVEPNPDWPANVRVDIRDPRWQEMLLRDEVPPLLERGFDGVMLDTIDTAPYLERKDPGRFSGSRQALRDWLRQLRERFPRAIVVANGGEALVDAAPFVDAFVVEGVFSLYDAGRRAYRATTDAERTWKLGAIARARAVAPRPVFSIEYADVGDVTLSKWAYDESLRHGFRPYVGVRDLNTAP